MISGAGNNSGEMHHACRGVCISAMGHKGLMLLKNSIPGWKTTVTGYAPKLVSTIFSGLRQSIVSEKWLFASSTEFFNRIDSL
jgi:hypothetical protein